MSNCDHTFRNSTVPNQAAGIFWAVVNRVLIILEIVALILSEVGWPMRFFDVYFPVLGSDFGLGPLGIFQALISATILSHHVDDFTLVAAFLLFSISCVNMFLGLIFRGKARVKRALFSWEKEGPQSPKLKGFELANPPVFKKPRDSFVARVFRRGPAADADDDVEHRGNGFTTEGEKAAMRAGGSYLSNIGSCTCSNSLSTAAWLSRPTQARPKYAPAPQPERSDSTMSGTTRSGTPVPEFKSSKTAI